MLFRHSKKCCLGFCFFLFLLLSTHWTAGWRGKWAQGSRGPAHHRRWRELPLGHFATPVELLWQVGIGDGALVGRFLQLKILVIIRPLAKTHYILHFDSTIHYGHHRYICFANKKSNLINVHHNFSDGTKYTIFIAQWLIHSTIP